MIQIPRELRAKIRGTVTEHEDGSISVDGTVGWSDLNLTKIPVKFKRVSGNFLISNNQLTSLEGAPDFVGKSMGCSNNQLASLSGLGYVAGAIYCDGNRVSVSQLLAEYGAKSDRVGESVKVKAAKLVEKLINEAGEAPAVKPVAELSKEEAFKILDSAKSIFVDDAKKPVERHGAGDDEGARNPFKLKIDLLRWIDSKKYDVKTEFWHMDKVCGPFPELNFCLGNMADKEYLEDSQTLIASHPFSGYLITLSWS